MSDDGDDDDRKAPGRLDDFATIKRDAEAYARKAEVLGKAIARKAVRDAKALGKVFERDFEAIKRQAEAYGKAYEREAEAYEHEAERAAAAIKREAEREAEAYEENAEAYKREAEKEAEAFEREAEAFEREAEREAEAFKRELDKDAEAYKREAEALERTYERDTEAPDGEDRACSPTSRRDEARRRELQREDEAWAKFEQKWQRHAERRARWEERHAERRARWEARNAQRWKRLKSRRGWKELDAERQMWLRESKHRRGWGPWWMQARMRRRIFIWLALAFGGGALTMYGWPSPHWWHAVVAVVALGIVSGIISFQLTRPLIMVIRVAQDIGDGKLQTRLEVDRHRGETRLLALAINEMAERIEQQLKDQRQLLAAVSHELRTPLGHMRVLIDTARATKDAKALGELEKEVLVLDDLVGRLLASSRLEFGNLDCRPLDLGELVSDVATASGVAPELIEAKGDVVAAADPTLVRRALANLLDNARVHGGGAVAVRIERRAGQVAIEVDDAGPGMAADRRADAFRAFVPSRAGGLGLGLALVSRIAVAHGGGAWVTDRPGGGARVGFTVEVAPRTAPPA